MLAVHYKKSEKQLEKLLKIKDKKPVHLKMIEALEGFMESHEDLVLSKKCLEIVK